MELTAHALVAHPGVQRSRITAILHVQRGFSENTASTLFRYLGTTPEFRVNPQNACELRLVEIDAGNENKRAVGALAKAA